MTMVFAIRGPGAGQRIEVPTADVAAAVAADGWAVAPTPGTVLSYAPDYPYSRDWKIPGYIIPDWMLPPEEPEADTERRRPSGNW